MRRLVAVLLFLNFVGCGHDDDGNGQNGGHGPHNPPPPPRTASAAPTFSATPGSAGEAASPTGLATTARTATASQAAAGPTATATRTPSVFLLARPVVGNPGDTVQLEIRLSTLRDPVAGTQNDLGYGGTSLRIAAKANGKPDCTVNPDLDKKASSFAFRPAECTADTCTSVRALVLATDNTDPIADGSLLYTCVVEIAADATQGTILLPITGVIGSTPSGTRISDAVGVSAQVIVRSGPIPTPAPSGMPCEFVTDCISTNCIGGVCCESAVCPFSQSCSVPGHAGVCFERQANGQACSGNQDCASGFCRSDGVCANLPRPDGTFCDSDDDCFSSHCVDNACCAVAACPAGQACNLPFSPGQCAAPLTPTATSSPILSKTPTATRTPTAPPVRLDATVLDVDTTDNTAHVGVILTAQKDVVGVQNDLILTDPNARFLGLPNGRPDCEVNPAINKPGSGFAFLAEGCDAEGCSNIRAVIVSLSDLAPIPSGSLLYSCRVEIRGGSSDLVITNPIASSSTAGRFATIVFGTTVTTSAPVHVVADGGYVDSTTLLGELTVRLDASGYEVAGAQNDLRLEGPGAAILRRANGRPDCTVNPDIDKAATSFSFRDPNCTNDCTVVRALVLSVDNTNPIPDGTTLYTCRITGTNWASIFIENVIASSPAGQRIPAIGLNGNTIFGGPTPTP